LYSYYSVNDAIAVKSHSDAAHVMQSH